jgi:hypothetical protein
MTFEVCDGMALEAMSEWCIKKKGTYVLTYKYFEKGKVIKRKEADYMCDICLSTNETLIGNDFASKYICKKCFKKIEQIVDEEARKARTE